jgi:DNA-binding HxlR family transcriptional regulator
MSWKDTISQTGLTVKMAREIRSLVEGQEMTTTSIIKSLNDRGYRRVTRKGITNYLRELESEGIVQKMRSGSNLDRISYRRKN